METRIRDRSTAEEFRKVYYRSDWPETGLDGPVSVVDPPVATPAWQGVGNRKWRWVSERDDFESQLYGLPVWNLRLEILDSGSGWLAKGLNSTRLFRSLQEILQQFLAQTPWPHAYVAAKVVQDEPLFQVLVDAGFEQVEQRCLYKCNVRNLVRSRENPGNPVQYKSLAEITINQRDRVREQILEICREGFQHGYSRHYSDPFLLSKATGLTYILEVMSLNFKRVPLELVLLALDTDSDCLCGFSILSERPGSGNPHYTQLLSATRREYRGRGVYAGLTRQLPRILPNDTQLLNVTHAENCAMRRAYQDTGRLHYADTVVLRRIFGSAAPPVRA